MISSLEFNRTRKPRPDAVGVFCGCYLVRDGGITGRIEVAGGEDEEAEEFEVSLISFFFHHLLSSRLHQNPAHQTQGLQKSKCQNRALEIHLEL